MFLSCNQKSQTFIVHNFPYNINTNFKLSWRILSFRLTSSQIIHNNKSHDIFSNHLTNGVLN